MSHACTSATVLLLGTCDTKLQELLFLKDQIRGQGSVEVILLDVGRDNVEHDAIDITQATLITKHGEGKKAADLPRGELIKFMAACARRAVKELFDEGKIHGIINAAEVMREVLPIGFPKMIVSTVASGDTGPIVGETDIAMLYSVVDVAGLNQVLRNILSNAGAAIGAAAKAYASRQRGSHDMTDKSKKRIGITMFGVTTPGVDAIRGHLESKYDVEIYVFHATGHGGKAMERLVRQGELDAVLDLTTTEICDLHTGGVMSAGQDRLQAAAEAGIPNIISLGATDMTNFGPKSTVPEKYKNRKLYEHNPTVTLMRSSAEECKQVGQFIAEKLRSHARRPELVQLWMPLGGVSMIATPGGPFADEEADQVLFTTVRDGLAGSNIKVVEDKRDINDEGFAQDIAEALAGLLDL
ncbi:transcriptional regulator [Diaporthe amygdali]|uniref:transcriptional regulator n=1 Tax=Phomopsis amygdali TaxID=1214568 RepID=UPI0022FEFC2F|nr:transcriptional regulator [Diaporthe amygdali]KAJ0119758.1 transcriptional regulator [Diaporthe amygdali]